MVVGEWPFFGCEILLFWLRNRLFLVAESSFFGCGIGYFWLRKRLFLVAEACLILVAESPKFGCGSVEIWFRNRTLSPYFPIELRILGYTPIRYLRPNVQIANLSIAPTRQVARWCPWCNNCCSSVRAPENSAEIVQHQMVCLKITQMFDAL